MIVFIYEHNKTVGAGHYMRCKSVSAAFSTAGLPSLLVDVTEFDYEGEEGNMYILDLFSIDTTTALLQKISGNNLLCTFDYFSNAALPDLNISVFEQFSEQRLYPSYTGLEYCIIRDEFMKQPVIDDKPKEIFVYIGGEGSKSIVADIAKKLAGVDYKVKLIRNQNSEATDKLPANFEVHYLPPNLAELMNNSSFAITSPGLATMELLYLKVPSVLYPLNSLHDKFSAYFIENDLAICNYPDFHSIDPERIEQVRKAGSAAVDGKGLERIIHLTEQHYEQKMGHRYPRE